MAYLGRISAVLTAQTRDFSRPIGEARRELQNFAQQARGVKFNLDNRALNGVLTDLQRINRTISEINNQRALGRGAGLPDPDRLRDLYRAFQDLGRPLTAIKTQVEGLATSIQSQLYPELDRITAGFINIYRAIDSGTTTFDNQARAIEALQRRLANYRNAVSALGDLNKLTNTLNANNVGASFFQPRTKEALQRTIELRNDAQNVPSRFRNSSAFAQLSADAEQNANAIEEAAARVAAANLEILNNRRVTPTMRENVAREQEALDRLTQRQNAINAQFQRELRSAEIRKIVSPEAVSQVDALTERAAKLSARLREGNDTQFETLIRSVGRVVEQLNRGEVSARRAKQAVDALAAADFSKAFAASGFKDSDKLLRTDSERLIADIRKNAAAERAGVIGRVGAVGLIGPDRLRKLEDINRRENISLAREEFNRAVAGRFEDLGRRTKELKDSGLSQRFDELRRLALNASASIKSAFNEKDPERARAAVETYRLKIAALTSEVDKFEARVKSAEVANRRFYEFLTISGSRSDKLGSSLTRFASDIAVTRQFAGNLDSNNISGRAAVERRIESDLKFAERVTRGQQKISDNASISEAERDRRRRIVDATVARRRAESVDILVEASDGTLTKGRVNSAMERAAKNRGSFGIGGAAAAQLALQQGLFAIDDLISSTGGLEYKLRAVGNNITQLGLLLGQSGVIPGLSATTGLMVGLGVVIGGQVISALLRYVTAARKAEEASKALGKSVERQSSLLSQIGQGYDQIGKSLANAGFSEAAKSAQELAESLRKIVEQQAKLRSERLSFADPASLDAARQIERIDEEKTKASTPGERIAFERQRAENLRILERRAEELRNGATPTGKEVVAALIDAERRLRLAQKRIDGNIFGVENEFASGNIGTDPMSFLRYAYTASVPMAPNQLRMRSPIDPVLRAAELRASELAKAVPVNKDGIAAQRAAIDELIERLKGKATEKNVLGYQTAAAKDAAVIVADLQALLVSLEGDSGLIEYLSQASSASRNLAAAQNAAAQAIEKGIPGAGALRARLDDVAKEISDSQEKIRRENERLERLGPYAKNEDVQRRNDAVAAEREKIDAARARSRALLEESDALARLRGFGGQRLANAASSVGGIGGNDGFFGLTSVARRRLQNEDIARRDLEFAIRDRIAGIGTQEQEDAAKKVLEDNQRANEQFAVFLESLKSAADSLAAFADSLKSSTDESRQQVGRLQQELATGTPEFLGGRSRDVVLRERNSALQANIEDEQRAAELSANLAFKTAELNRRLNGPGKIGDRFRELDDRRKQIEQEAQTQNGITPEQHEELRKLRIEEAKLLAERNRIILEGTRAERDAIDEQVRQVAERRRIEEARARGRELLKTPAQRLAEQFSQDIFDIRAEANQNLGNARIQQDARDAINRQFLERARQAAPAIIGFRDERLNASLQGPSRQALNVSDVQTMEGARELNRLLRGDDPSKDVNLQELKEQTRLLDELVNAARQRGEIVELRG